MGTEWTEKTNKWSSEEYRLLKHNARWSTELNHFPEDSILYNHCHKTLQTSLTEQC